MLLKVRARKLLCITYLNHLVMVELKKHFTKILCQMPRKKEYDVEGVLGKDKSKLGFNIDTSDPFAAIGSLESLFGDKVKNNNNNRRENLIIFHYLEKRRRRLPSLLPRIPPLIFLISNG
jgi:hypothetical protein